MRVGKRVAGRALLGVLACALALATAWTLVPALTARAQDAPTITSTLPSWLAPGAPLRVRGRATPESSVELWIGERKRAETTSGSQGGFSFRVRLPREPGRYAVVVAEGEARVKAGVLPVRPLRLAAVGDVTFGADVRAAIGEHGPRWPWLSVARTLRSADLAVANLEGAVSTRGSPWPGKQYTFRGRPAALSAAASYAGIDVVSLANNHSLDYGRAAFLDTLAHARRAGIRTIGGGRSLGAARRPAILERGGLRIAFLGFSDVRPLGFDAGATTPGTTPGFPEIVRRDVRAARRRADVVIAYLHWGVERSRVPSPRQRSLGEVALDSGATVVLGAHPHVLQPVERRGRKLVAWSLGNFVFGSFSPATRRTGILRIGLEARGVTDSSLRRARIHWVQPRLLR